MPDETKLYGDRTSPEADEPLAAGMPSMPPVPAPTAAAIPTEQALDATFAASRIPFADPAGLQLAAGTLLGEYVVQRKLGEGGMGTVYAGEHPAIGKLVAIKVLSPHCANDPELVRRFVEEARAANRIRHPNIIDIFSFGQLPDLRPYFVMEFLDGESLAEAIDKGALRPTELCRLLCQICGALEASHQVGIVHRDLKPENIWIARPPHGESYVKLLDFGIAKLLDTTRTNLTQTGAVMGTPIFMAPEQCMGREVDARTDIYALGVILYRMFAGRFPFQGTVITELVFKHMTELPTPPSLHRQMPADLERIILDCLAKDPNARPQSARLLGDRLAAALDAWPAIAVGVATGPSALTTSTVPPPVAVPAATPVLTRPARRVSMVRRPTFLVSAMLALAAAGGFLFLRTHSTNQTAPQPMPRSFPAATAGPLPASRSTQAGPTPTIADHPMAIPPVPEKRSPRGSKTAKAAHAPIANDAVQPRPAPRAIPDDRAGPPARPSRAQERGLIDVNPLRR